MMEQKKGATSGGSDTPGRRGGAVVPGTPVSSTDDGLHKTGAPAGTATAKGRGEFEGKGKDNAEGGWKRRKLDRYEEGGGTQACEECGEVVREKASEEEDSGSEEEQSGEEDMEAESEEEGSEGWPDPMDERKNREFVLARVDFARESASLIEEYTTRNKRMSKTEKTTINGHGNYLRSGEEDMEAESEEEGSEGWPDPMDERKNREFVLARVDFARESASLIEEYTTRNKRMSKTERTTINGHGNYLRRYCEDTARVFKSRTEALERRIGEWEDWWERRKDAKDRRKEELKEWESKGMK
ncbi:cilia- and flagella-associated protein 251-like [Odontomachus brunneus]|uniref:cilia- and flagella-associated protein 251-like n=1 Tax=Odontomachus brunneus TaxID=486640 RepID=UPI0013F1D18D|nr:cilia- and flagella-associated protein 251-like [Odontomachus brunneus]